MESLMLASHGRAAVIHMASNVLLSATIKDIRSLRSCDPNARMYPKAIKEE